ncbi:MAG: UvrD-helicase domain-containing protein [Acidimicrobiia bacterium]|nr:UvrD-helicase domain-containing protein [Acidimicrobiia bacterium]
MDEPVLIDDDSAAREAIGTLLAETLFAEAGAGSGKTKSLVDRVVALITADDDAIRVPMRHIAAITFTDKAAAELRDRIRKELELGAADPSRSEQFRERCREALDEVDSAAISTLHAFAQRLLTEHPIEAGLPPGVEVLDEISSQVDFDERWRRFVDRLLEDPSVERGAAARARRGRDDRAVPGRGVAVQCQLGSRRRARAPRRTRPTRDRSRAADRSRRRALRNASRLPGRGRQDGSAPRRDRRVVCAGRCCRRG